ncbi:hypothetical protein [Microvirga aerophila]|uniref:Uncharacterized protein n=1 Tax=Microvirga aerophila TaxID=670291 RepID=A0A512C336_9HYPH|nr:hypothetical protein [Microvirga aerophila]GEO18625.1 hypothetical protein MAE02_63210 [Microvirga aerophila]
MPEARVGIRVADDRKTVTIEITPLGQIGHPVALTLDQLDHLMSKLGDARCQMMEGQPGPSFESEDAPISVAANTRWTIRASPPAGALLGFYHPKFGTVGFTLPKDEIVRIVGFLTERFILQPTASPEKH